MENLNLFELLTGMVKSLAEYAPNVLGAIVLLLVGWLLAKFITRILQKLLNKIGVDKLSDYINNMELFGESSFTISLTKIVATFVYYAIMLIVWVAAADILGIQAITDLLNDIIAYVPNLLVAFVYLLLGIFLADLARKFVLTTLQSLGIPSASLIAGFVFYFLIINILLGALTQAKVNTEFIAANISIILGGVVLAFAIGYGLASKDIAANLISSFYWKDKFDVGDELEVEGIKGRVKTIEKSHLVLETANGDAVVPMNKVSRNTIIVKKQGN